MHDIRRYLNILTEKGLAPRPNVVQSAEFRRWFGDSEAVDEAGNPWICYHGTRHEFHIFDAARTGQSTDFGWFGEGIYLTPDPETASNYASQDQEGRPQPNGRVMPLYVRATDPFKTDQATMSRQYVAEILEDGHDAIFFYSYRSDPLPQEIIVFKSNQLKSALANQQFTDSDSISESPFASMTRDQFLGDPTLTTPANARDLKPKVLGSLADTSREPFMGKFMAAYGEDGAVVFDGDVPIASYNFGDTLVVAPRYRRQGIGEELVYQWRSRYPDAKPAKHRTKASHALQQKVWDRIEREKDVTEAKVMPPFAQWVRWWGDANTGKLTPVPFGQHDDFFMEHLPDFLDHNTIARVVGDDEPWDHLDVLLTTAYAQGWGTVLYDGTTNSLMLQGSENLRAVQKFAVQIANEYPIETVHMDIVKDGALRSLELTGPPLERFLKTGKVSRITR